MQIRIATAEDIPELTNLGRQLLDIHTGFDPDYYTLEENFSIYFSDWLKNQLYTPRQTIFVAVDQLSENEPQKIIGFIAGFIKSLYPWFKVKAVGHVSYLIISPEFRKNHIGKHLEEALILWFKNQGVAYIEVYSDEKNLLGVSAWTSYGYQPFKKYLRKKIF